MGIKAESVADDNDEVHTSPGNSHVPRNICCTESKTLANIVPALLYTPLRHASNSFCFLYLPVFQFLVLSTL